MRKAIIVLFAALMAVSLVSAQKFSGVRMDDSTSAGNYIELHANARNNLNVKVDDAQIVVWIPELDIYEKSSSFDILRGTGYGRFMHIYVPKSAASGLYIARISLIHGGDFQHQWRMIEIN